jgi:hypothetical protein
MHSQPTRALAIIALVQAHEALRSAAAELRLAVVLASTDDALRSDALVVAQAIEFETLAIHAVTPEASRPRGKPAAPSKTGGRQRLRYASRQTGRAAIPILL